MKAAKSGSPLCTVVIRAFNEEAHVGRLLEGIGRQTVREVEVVLVDSGSTDRTAGLAAELGARLVAIAPDEFTFGRALNLGCAVAGGEFIIIASAHVYPVYTDWIARLLEPMMDPRMALVYGRQRGDETSRFSERQVFAAWYPEQAIARQDHPFCNNANAAIRRELWQRRCYSEELPGLEDVDWATWAQSQGFHIAYSSEAEVVHIHEETLRAIYNRYRREGMALKLIQPQESFHFSDFLRLTATNVVSDLRQARASRGLGREAPGILAFRLMQFWGTFQGFRHAGPLTSELKRAFYYPRGVLTSEAPRRGHLPPINYNSGPIRATQSKPLEQATDVERKAR